MKKTETGKNFISTLSVGFFDSLKIFPIALAVGICAGLGASATAVTAVLCALSGMIFGYLFTPSWLTLLPLFCLSYRFGASAAFVAVMLSGIFSLILSITVKKDFIPSSVKSGFLLAAAFCTTALQTTNYFGIGAKGADAVEIIKDYISLGFHGNWRGVLYGTIVLVVMITYPKKFKKLNSKIPASFVAVAGTLVLNFFLNPDKEYTAINEISSAKIETLLSGAFFKGGISSDSIWLIVITALALSLTVKEFFPFDEKTGKTKKALCASANVFSGLLGGAVISASSKEKRTVWEGLSCTVFTVLLFFLCPTVLERIPLHSLAVVLIVGAWQSIGWSDVKKSFKGGIKTVVMFVIFAVLSVLLPIHYVLPAMAVFGIVTGKNKADTV